MMRFSRHSGNPNIGVFAAVNESLAFTSADGQEHPALEAVEVFIDGNDPVFLLEDDSGTGDATGRKHTMVIELLDENDKPIESRTITFSIAELSENLEINVAEFWLRAR